MKIALLNIFYNNRPELERLCNSIPPNCIDYFIAIDGLFGYTAEKNPDLPLLSNDGSRELLLNQKKFKTCIFDMPKSIEVDKRNKYLELSEKYDITVGIILDSDELFYYYDKDPVEQWTKFRSEIENLAKINPKHNVYSIKCILSDDYALMEYHRVWYRPGEMRYYRNSHYHYLNMKNGEYESVKNNKTMHTQQSIATIKSLFLRHNHSFRTNEQMQQRREYQHYLINYELLVQKNTPPDTADQIAKMYPYPPPSKTIENVDTCPCDHCAPIKPNYDPSKIIKRKF